MKAVIINLLILFTVTSSYHLKGYERRYYPEEDLPYPHQYFVMEGDDGDMHLVNLAQKSIDVQVELSDVRLYLFTAQNPSSGFLIKPEEFTGRIDLEDFDSTKSLFVSSHGYMGSYLASSNVGIRDAIFENYDPNVLLVDWSSYSKEFYTDATFAVPQVGKIVGGVIAKIAETYNIPYSKIDFAGQSLGAHVVGAAGAALGGKIHSIVGTDPALPLFSYNDTDKRLDVTDAEFVHVIHTNGGLLGFRSSIGHVDYFPNGGGMNQPGCGSDLFGSCAHGRSYKYHAESVSKFNFIAKACASYDDFKEGLCDENRSSHMCEYLIDTTASGDYYLETASESPYGLN